MALQIGIASPCDEKWESMRGGERSRHCLRCQLFVFNIEDMTETEVCQLVAEKQGRVCVRLFRRPDGTVLTRDCPTGVRRLQLRLLRGATAAVALFAGLVGYRAMTVAPSCPVDEEEQRQSTSLLRRLDWTIERTLVDAREALRETRTLGPLIDRLSPRPRYMGRMSTIINVASPAPEQPALERGEGP